MLGSGTRSNMTGMAAAIPIWNLGSWFSGKSLKLFSPDVRF